MSFKGNKVWVEKGDDGRPAEKNGKVRIKYNLKQNYEYWIKKENLLPESSAVSSKNRKKRVDSPLESSAIKQEQTNSTLKHKNKNPIKNKNFESTQDRNKNLLPENLIVPENAITIFTDGASSGNPGPSGIGVVLIHGEHEKEISEYIGHATNNIAELMAIKRALSQLKRNDLPVRLFSDSSYSIGVLTKGWKATSNRELVEEIRSLMQKFYDIELIKIKGHSGEAGNERADLLATTAIKQQ
ncbi:Ribonuclease H [Desulfamplus magnetovallimortis]|uniref:ribonuclease H n=1 Tax=Desulfamplus magnetovallimortis TaxID=1246637 RepID=A0A1W1HDF1_9BACT|nr:ribonuclease H [Desulfamplus magnetovallimortis]SLM30524.1 Ribonuclease H [Desulfamplus magnetovallimortis]